MKSAYFCKPDFDNSNNSKVVTNKKKKEYGFGNSSKESLSLQERLQTSVKVVENCYPPATPKMLVLFLKEGKVLLQLLKPNLFLQ